MIAAISPSIINGTVTAPASKSVMQRACAMALLNKGITIIQNPGNSNDDRAALKIIHDLGAVISYEKDHIIVNSSGKIKSGPSIDCGESGLSLRMFAAIAALGNDKVTFTGNGSLLKRPLHFFDEVFPLLDVDTKTSTGFLPVSFQGPLIPKDISIDASKSSQYLTGLLFAFAKAAKKTVSISVNDLKSRPYIDLSLQILDQFGYRVHHEGYSAFHIKPVEEIERKITCNVEGDWSGAAFLLVAGAIAGNIRIKGLDIYSAQADHAIMEVLEIAGADISVEGSCVLVNDQNTLSPFEFDATDCPDLFPPLVALAAYCNGRSVIKGISRLEGKESNRAETLKDVFSRMNVGIILQEDSMIINGGNKVNGAEVASHHDHRIAMACAVAALKADSMTKISNSEAVNKSYPAFYEHLQMLGASVSLTGQ